MVEERVVRSSVDSGPDVPTKDFGPSLTRQSEAKDADINNILERFVRTGVVPVNERPQLFLDVSEVGDFRRVRDHINEATDYFMSLDAKIRAEFENDPANFLDFMVVPENRDKLIEMGILPKEEAAPVVSVVGVAGGAVEPPKDVKP